MALPGRAILGLLSLAQSTWLSHLTRQQQKKFMAAVEQQIREGRSAREALTRSITGMIENNPHTAEARAVLREQASDAKNQVGIGQELYGQRESDVMGYLEGVGDQSIKDINRTFGEEAGLANSRLVERGLSGGGVGASIAHGFATREADALARSREAIGSLKSNTLAGLRGDTLSAREAALDQAYGEGTTLADFEGGVGQEVNNAFYDNSDAYINEIYGVQNVPPDTSAQNASWAATGDWLGRVGS